METGHPLRAASDALQADRPEAALEALAEELTGRDVAWQVHYLAALALRASGRADEALPHYAAAFRSRSPSAEAWLNWGNAYRDAGACEDALAAYERACEAEPGLALAWSHRGNLHAERGEFTPARECHRRAEALAPNSQAVLCHAAAADLAADDPASAVRRLERAGATTALPANAGVHLARALRKCGQRERAL
ncbi:MAG: tetratricopeptide repeat protein, partial [Proteobacteria bacterium]|nr:tetratricopeptide repeat protein [Pseudomonadota bacterium]